MRISYDWLKQYVNTGLGPGKLAELLTMAGLSVESVTGSGDDAILEIEITANRPDWLSYIGVAREVAALTGTKLSIPHVGSFKAKDALPRVGIAVEEKALCPRYTARVIRGVKVSDSPSWLKRRIEAMGLRPVNNIVDITNFCLFETGEPMHAFDLGRLAGARIVVRLSRRGEKITVIDGSEKALEESMLVIADAERPVAVAGVMGGLSTEVSRSTADILLEAACFDPVSIRRTSRKLGLSSESSYRFERRVDRESVAYASDRALGLILETAGGVPGEFVDVGSATGKLARISLRCGRLNDVLGTPIRPMKIRKICASLGMKVTGSGNGTLKVVAPPFRSDIKAEIDVIEEVARVYGYDKIPSTIPAIVEQPVRVERAMGLRRAMREALSAMGVDEIMTYSLLGKRQISAAGLSPDAVVEVRNPLTSEQEAMRPSLIPGMLGAVAWNINRKSPDLRLYELGNVYKAVPGGEPREEMRLAIGIAGDKFSGWAGGTRPADFFELKGIFESLLRELGVRDVSFDPCDDPVFAPSQCARVSACGRAVAVMGLLGAKALGGFDIKEKVYMLEADADELMGLAAPGKSFSCLARFPSVSRDISIVVPAAARNADIILAIKAAAGPLLRSVALIDRYRGKQIPDDKVGLTYRLEYQDPSRTLEERTVSEAHENILRSLGEKLGAKLR